MYPCAESPSGAFTQSVWREPGSVFALHERGSSVAGMDILAIAISVVVFAALWASIEVFDRV
jgi:hypothetical protein